MAVNGGEPKDFFFSFVAMEPERDPERFTVRMLARALRLPSFNVLSIERGT